MRHFFFAILLFPLLVFLLACGQKGPLYLPQKKAENNQQKHAEGYGSLIANPALIDTPIAVENPTK